MCQRKCGVGWAIALTLTMVLFLLPVVTYVRPRGTSPPARTSNGKGGDDVAVPNDIARAVETGIDHKYLTNTVERVKSHRWRNLPVLFT